MSFPPQIQLNMSTKSKKKHDRGPGFVCIFCNRHFNGTCDEGIHIRRHIQEKPYNCSFCDFTAVCATDINCHKRNVHLKETYKCSCCDQTFKTTFALKNHFGTAHAILLEMEKKLSCEFCGREFNLASTLTTHRRTHTGERPYKCTVCGKDFIQKGNLNIHMRRHTGERSLECPECSKQFFLRHDYQLHWKANHKGLGPVKKAIEIRKKKNNNRKKYLHQNQTTSANKVERFETNEMLEQPLTKNFTCQFCGREFSLHSTLISHQKTHMQHVIIVEEMKPTPSKVKEEPGDELVLGI